MKKLFIMLTIMLTIGVGIFYFFMGEDILADYYIESAENQTDVVKSVELYNKGLELQPENISARNKLVDIYITHENYELAYKEIAEGLLVNNNNVELILKRVLLYQKNGEIKKAIDSMESIESNYVNTSLNSKRNDIPTVNYQSGEYHEVIGIELDCISDSNIYYSLNNEEYILYKQPFSLYEGFTIVNAVTISSEGVVSQIVKFEYNINNITTPVMFTSDDITIEVLNQVSSLDPDYADDTTVLDLSGQVVTNTDLQSITNFNKVTTLILGDVSGITNFECLKNMESLTSIEINSGLTYQEFCKIVNLSKLEELTVLNSYIYNLPNNTNSLKKLVVKNCFLSDIYNIGSYKSLIYLDLSQNEIVDIYNISEIKKLNYLNLAFNQIENISSLKSLISIKIINLSNNNLNSISQLCNLLFLEDIDVSNNQITTVKDFVNLKYLTVLNCSFNNILTLEPLVASQSLLYIYANDNLINDISYISKIENLLYINTENNNIVKY